MCWSNSSNKSTDAEPTTNDKTQMPLHRRRTQVLNPRPPPPPPPTPGSIYGHIFGHCRSQVHRGWPDLRQRFKAFWVRFKEEISFSSQTWVPKVFKSKSDSQRKYRSTSSPWSFRSKSGVWSGLGRVKVEFLHFLSPSLSLWKSPWKHKSESHYGPEEVFHPNVFDI